MKITFDHNCLIHVENGGSIAEKIQRLMADPVHQCFVVNVGASEMQKFGVRPDNYEAFEQFLVQIGAAHLPRLDPIGIYDVTFWDKSIFCGESDEALFEAIKAALFGSDDQGADIAERPKSERKKINRLCDTLSMWCHISYGNDVFLTTDGNFTKATKLPHLLGLGAGLICHPSEI